MIQHIHHYNDKHAHHTPASSIKATGLSQETHHSMDGINQSVSDPIFKDHDFGLLNFCFKAKVTLVGAVVQCSELCRTKSPFPFQCSKNTTFELLHFCKITLQ